MFKTDVQKLRNALEFTRVYKENANDIYLREAACMDFQLRHILVPMDENDGIAGRYEHDFVGFSSQVGGIYTYYFMGGLVARVYGRDDTYAILPADRSVDSGVPQNLAHGIHRGGQRKLPAVIGVVGGVLPIGQAAQLPHKAVPVKTVHQLHAHW